MIDYRDWGRGDGASLWRENPKESSSVELLILTWFMSTRVIDVLLHPERNYAAP